ncbi:glutathione S-transferase T2-like [Chenopodium quinoa]|uniref:glutathione S-transferase T2-like n=1 Tax=Chenopodium quinoa TaxID=63459 RepID=UPI000B788DF5|nr:glutathione S-transferase T2-like [Chenopodium quinoa]
MNIPKSNRKKKSTKSHNSSQPQNNPNPQPYYSNLPIDLNSDLDTNFQNFPNYGSQNLNFSNPSTFTPFPFQPPQNPNYSNSPNVIPSFENIQISQIDSTFPMSQHFSMSQGDGAFSSFDCSYTSNASDDENEPEVEEGEGNERGNEGGNQDGRKIFWSKAEEVVLVKAWLEVSQNKKTNTNQKGDVFWRKIEEMYNNVRLYKQRCFEEGTDRLTREDLLKMRGTEQLRNRWRRINASCSKFCGSHAHAESKKGSGMNDEDVMKLAYSIYANDKTKSSLCSKTFQDKHVWDILKQHEAWKPSEDVVKKCKEKTSTQGSDSKRSRINEAGNYSSSSNPETPTSGDIGYSGFPSSNESSKNKGKSKVPNMPSGAWQQWLDTAQNMNLLRQSENEVELTRLQLEREKEARKQRKINMELFKHLDSKPNLSSEDQELRSTLLKKLFPSD